MARLLTKAGYQVLISDLKAGPVSWEAAAQSEVVLVAVPLPAFEEVMRQLGPHTRKQGVVIDLASVKAGPLQSMLEHCKGEVIGSHPLFGPETTFLKDQIVFVCPVRSKKWISWFRSFLQELGALVVEIEPTRHDQLMSRVQVLRHLLLLCFGRSLMRLDFDLERDLPLAGVWFTSLVALLRRQMAQGPELYADLARSNPAAGQVFEEFLKAAEEVALAFNSQDRPRIIRLMNEVSSYLQPPADSNPRPEDDDRPGRG